MSNKDVHERTEPPTPRRLRKLREKGSVAKSRDLSSAAALTGILTALCIAWPWYLEQFQQIVMAPFRFINQPFHEAVISIVTTIAIKGAMILGPLLFVAVFLAVIACLIQFGVVFSMDPVLPKMERLDPFEGLKRMFSLPRFVEATKAVVKTLVLGCALYFLIRQSLQALVMLPFHGISSVLQMTVRLAQHIFLMSIIVFLSMSLVDVLVQKRLFLHENRMSKDDVKRDIKEAEGDPLIKGMRKFLYTILSSSKSSTDDSSTS